MGEKFFEASRLDKDKEFFHLRSESSKIQGCCKSAEVRRKQWEV